MRRTLVFFVLATAVCSIFLINAGPAQAWNSYVHQRLAWMVLPEISKTPIEGYWAALIFGANEPDDHKGILKLRDHWKSKRRCLDAFNASVGAFRRGCMQETARRLGHAFHYLEDFGCCRKPFGHSIKDRVEKYAKAEMKLTVTNKSSVESLRNAANEYLSEELRGARTPEAVLAKVETARNELVKMIRYIEKEYKDEPTKKEKYLYVVHTNLAITLGAMIQLTRIYKDQTSRIWNAKQVSPQCHCPKEYRLNQARNDCYYGNRNVVIKLPQW
jgi:hypothetical protein